MNKCTERLYNGIVKENPTFVQMLGMCPTLAVTTSAVNGVGMGLTTTVILTLSNMMISLLRKIIPDRVRIPAYIIVIASFVTVVQFLLEGFVPSLNDSLGIFIPLIVVNCIILGRAESYASKNPVIPSAFDGLGMGLGFTVGLTSIGAFRELLGAGTVFGIQIMPKVYEPITIFILAPGAFFVLAFLIAVQNKARMRNAEKAGEEYDVCRSEDCAHCANMMCGGRFFVLDDTDVDSGKEAADETTTTKSESTDQIEKKAKEKENTKDPGKSSGDGGSVSEPESSDLGKKPAVETEDPKDKKADHKDEDGPDADRKETVDSPDTTEGKEA